MAKSRFMTLSIVGVVMVPITNYSDKAPSEDEIANQEKHTLDTVHRALAGRDFTFMGKVELADNIIHEDEPEERAKVTKVKYAISKPKKKRKVKKA